MIQWVALSPRDFHAYFCSDRSTRFPIGGRSIVEWAEPSPQAQPGSEIAQRAFVRINGESGYEIPQPGSVLNAKISAAGALDLSNDQSGRHGIVKFDSFGFGSGQLLASPPTTLRTSTAENGWPQLSLVRNGVEELFVNSNKGLEQSFRISARPKTSSTGKLWLKLSVSGDLLPKTIDDDRIELVSEKGSEIYYRGLKAWDARGKRLDARMEAIGNSIQLTVDDANAQYPVTIDPTWGQQDRLVVGDGISGDPFARGIGRDVALSGDTAVVGGRVVKIFTRSLGTWQLQQTLTINEPDYSHSFGNTVAVSGDTLFVGASLISSGASDSGAVFVYQRSGTTWTLSQKISSPALQYGANFGDALSIEGNTLVVGAPGTRVSGLTYVGAVYIYGLSGATWTYLAKLDAPEVVSNNYFGETVSLSGGRIAVSTNRDRAYIFSGSGSSWSLGATINLKGDVSLLNDRLVIGCTLYHLQSGTWSVEASFPGVINATNAIDTDVVAIGGPDQSGISEPHAGSVQFYRYLNGAWVAGATLTASDGVYADTFGESVAFKGNTAIVGAPHAKNLKGQPAGKAYAFYQGSFRMVFDKSFLRAGSSALGQIFILTAAPAGGLTIPLSCDNASLIVPSQVTIPAGAKHVDFTAMASDSVGNPAEATVTAVMGSEVQKSVIALDSYVKSITVDLGGDGVGPFSLTGTVTMNVPAPAGGLTITLSSSNPAALTVPTSLDIPAGATQATFSGMTAKVNVDTPVTVSAIYNTATTSVNTVVRTMLGSISVSPLTVTRDSSVVATIYVNREIHGDLPVTLTTDRPTFLNLPSTITVQKNQRTASFTVTTTPGTTATVATITASYRNATKTCTLTIVIQKAVSIVISPKSVQGGVGATRLQVNLKAEAGIGGVDVFLASSDPTIASVPAKVHIVQGAKYAQIIVKPTAVTSNQVITFSANCDGQAPVTNTLTVTP